jgi:hypothetical protein
MVGPVVGRAPPTSNGAVQASVLAYIQALGGRLTVEAEVDGRIYTVDLAETA